MQKSKKLVKCTRSQEIYQYFCKCVHMYNESEHILKDIYSDICIRISKLISGITMRIRNVDMHIIVYVSVVHVYVC